MTGVVFLAVQLTNGSNDVGNNVVLGALFGESFGETDLAQLGSCLTSVSLFVI
jgi:hypothetical protein